MRQRMALFIDGANHSQALKRAKVTMKYDNLLTNLRKTYELVGARYYSGVYTDGSHTGLIDFLDSLKKKGYNVITKPVREYEDGTVKGNMDIQIAVDMMSMANRMDHALLLSGDGDFCYLVDYLQRQGIVVTVCSYTLTTSTELKDQVNEFIDLQEFSRNYSY